MKKFNRELQQWVHLSRKKKKQNPVNWKTDLLMLYSQGRKKEKLNKSKESLHEL